MAMEVDQSGYKFLFSFTNLFKAPLLIPLSAFPLQSLAARPLVHARLRR
jgi:hypothetical protein